METGPNLSMFTGVPLESQNLKLIPVLVLSLDSMEQERGWSNRVIFRIDPLLKWRLNFNNNTYTTLIHPKRPHIHVKIVCLET